MFVTTDAERPTVERFEHRHCLMCGDLNPLSLRLHFQADSEGVCAEFCGHGMLQGYSGLMHGGVIASLLDSAMTHCLFGHNIRALTAEMNVQYLRPVPCGTPLKIRASVVKATPPLYYLRSEIWNRSEQLAAADAKFMQNGE